MVRVQRFIIQVRKAESEKREMQKRQEDPFRKNGEAAKKRGVRTFTVCEYADARYTWAP